MTHPGNTAASPNRTSLPVPPDHGLSDRSLRARTDRMAVTAFGTNLYEVDTDGGSYLVDVAAGRCTCPDHQFRDARCKHLRRVAIEVTEGRVPPPGEVEVPCRECPETTYVPNERADEGPHYCPDHRIEPGDHLRDRETGKRLVAVTHAGGRADEVPVDPETTVADYPGNESYDPGDPVVGAVYPEGRVTDEGVAPERLQVYAFPRSRLERVGPDRSDRPEPPESRSGDPTDRRTSATGGVSVADDGT